MRMQHNANPDASVSTIHFRVGSHILTTGFCVKSPLIVSKASSRSSVHLNCTFFLVNSVRGVDNSLHLGINLLQKLQNPKKDWTCLSVFGAGHSSTWLTFAGSTSNFPGD